jgi:hypothetical protein
VKAVSQVVLDAGTKLVEVVLHHVIVYQHLKGGGSL